MNERLLLEAATTLGYRLAMAGAETFRVEETIIRVLKTYGYQAEAFAIPNCLTVSIITESGDPMTRMRRIGPHGNDLDAVEMYSNLSRAICNRRPAPEELPQWLEYVRKMQRSYTLPIQAIGYFLSAFGFCITFGGTFADALGAGISGLIILAVDQFMDRLNSTQFFRTIIAAFCMAFFTYFIHTMGLVQNADASIIGTLMILVPGLLFTNAMRDIMYGDTNSGLNRVVLVLLIAVAIALGTAAALKLTSTFWGAPVGTGLVDYGFIMLNIGIFIGCVGFAIYFNVHSWGVLLTSFGGLLTWAAYLVAAHFGCGIVGANFWAAVVAAIFSEIMARVRKYPALSYLVVSIFPLLPGAGIYYTMSYILANNTDAAWAKGMETASISGVMAVGILLVVTAVRAIYTIKARLKKK